MPAIILFANQSWRQCLASLALGLAICLGQPNTKQVLAESKPPVAMAQVQDDAVKAQIENEVKRQIGERFKDQKLLEIETSEAIAERLMNWAKILGFFVGIPVAILLAGFAFLGYRSYSDFKKRIDEANRVIQSHVDTAMAQFKTVSGKGKELLEDYGTLREQVTAFEKNLRREMEVLSEKVDRIEEEIRFEPSEALTPDIQQRLANALDKFQSYFQDLGFQPPSDSVTVTVEPESMIGTVAYYDGRNNNMVVSKEFVEVTDVMLRQYANHVLLASNKSMNQATSTQGNFEHSAIGAGLATYFPCSFNDNPIFGSGKFDWNLENETPFEDFGPQNARSTASWVWGGFCWDVRKELGREDADRLLLSAWRSLDVSVPSAETKQNFIDALLGLEPVHGNSKLSETIRTAFQKRLGHA
jgi:hypothetical protein